MKINSRKFGMVLIILFILGLFTLTIYSRYYFEHQKPFVHVVFSRYDTFFWNFETRSIMRHATDAEAERGHKWITEIIIPYESFRDYVDELLAINAEFKFDSNGHFSHGELIYRRVLKNNDIQLAFSYHFDYDKGIISIIGNTEVTVRISHTGIHYFDYLLPFSAIHQDWFTGEQYVFAVRMHEGAWGTEYVVVRMNIHMCSFFPRVGNFANILSPSLLNVPVVLQSDKLLFNGDRVRIID